MRQKVEKSKMKFVEGVKTHRQIVQKRRQESRYSEGIFLKRLTLTVRSFVTTNRKNCCRHINNFYFALYNGITSGGTSILLVID